MRSRRIAILLVLMLSFSGLSSLSLADNQLANEMEDSPPYETGPGDVTICGYITYGLLKYPANNTEVHCWFENPFESPDAITYTNETGYYEFSDLPVGGFLLEEYFVIPEKDGYFPLGKGRIRIYLLGNLLAWSNFTLIKNTNTKDIPIYNPGLFPIILYLIERIPFFRFLFK